MNKYIKGVALGFGVLMMSSCASDYLDTPVYGVVEENDIYSTPELSRQAMLGVFSGGMCVPMQDLTPAQAFWQGETGIAFYLGEIPASDCYSNYIYDVAPSWAPYYVMQDTYLSSGDYVWNKTMWLYAYTNIAQLNTLISGLSGVEVSGEPDDVALHNFTYAQALAMRAHFYWRLLQVYGPRWVDSNNGEALTVILRTSPNDPQDMPVTTMNKVLDQCYADLDKSLQLFDAAGRSFRTLTYEIDKSVAYGIYARVAALKNDWETVRTMAHNARQGKRLATQAEMFSGYMSYNENEWMWSPSFEQVDNWIFGNFCTFFACNSYGAVNDRITNSINRDLYNQIPEGDVRANWWLTYDKLPGLRPALFYSNLNVNAETGAFKNSRLLNAARTWLTEHKPSNVTSNDAYEGATTSDKTTSILRDGAQVKFWVNGLTGQENMMQIPFMRATEMYLYEAEACAELGGQYTAQAQALLMEINTPCNPNYTCDLTGQALIDEVRLYRRIELWGEGFCWFDLKRWNVPMKRTAWKAGDINSGNVPTGVACDVPVNTNYGWRHGLPLYERSNNPLVTQPIP